MAIKKELKEVKEPKKRPSRKKVQAPPTLSRLPDDLPVKIMEDADYYKLIMMSEKRNNAILSRANLEKELKINSLTVVKMEEYDAYKVMVNLQKLEQEIATTRDADKRTLLIKEFDLDKRELDFIKREVAHIRRVLIPSCENSIMNEQARCDLVDKEFKGFYQSLQTKYKIEGEIAVNSNTMVIMETKRDL